MLARLLEFRDIAPAVRHFVFEAQDPLHFTAGQFVSLNANLRGKEITRAYSIASAANGKIFELCLNRVEGGLFSPYLFGLKQGEQISLRPPLGTFTLREPAHDSVCIATGTGIAPFRSMLRTYLRPDSPQFTLLFGVRHHSGLLYEEEFQEAGRMFARFRLMPTITQPEAGWTGRVGRVQAHLEEALAGRRDIDIYLCGLKPMVDDVRQKLKEMGFDRKQIRYEKYD